MSDGLVLGFLHGLIYLVSAWVVGFVIFERWIRPRSGVFRPRLFLSLTVLGLLLALTWAVVTGHDMAESWEVSDLLGVVSTGFGHIWCFEILIWAILVFSAVIPKCNSFRVLAVLIPLPFTLTGHAGSEGDSTLINTVLDGFHFLSVGVWTGGLASLWLWLRTYSFGGALKESLAYPTVQRFSHFAQVSTGIIGITGLILAYRYGLRLNSLPTSDYGKLVVAKFVLFGTALAAAGINQFIHLRKWKKESDLQFARAISREVSLEIFLVTLVIFIAGFLSRSTPPMSMH